MALGENYPIEFERTRMRVIQKATNLFVLRGFEGVSMNEVALAVGIKAPSLYNHFKNKEQILQAVFAVGMQWMGEYYRRFQEEDEKATSLEESMENIFVEIREVVDPFGFQVILLAQRYAACYPAAYELFYESFYNAGLRSIQRCIRRGQAKGYIPQGVSGEGFATLMMDFVAHNNVYWSMVGSEVYKLRHNRAWFDGMQRYFTGMLRAGI